jgi:glycosyltransferase involved in cell wall biosynthesis
MRVAHFSDGDNYGAFGAAYELHKTMLEQGIESHFFVRIKGREDESVEEVSTKDIIGNHLMHMINTLYFVRNRKDHTMSFTYERVGISFSDDMLQRFRGYDIIHLHWVSRLLNNDSIMKLLLLGKPIVWTMHDFNPMTGGCHYPGECVGYLENCSECPQLVVNKLDVTRFVLKDKKHVYGNQIHVITASEWLKKLVQKSYVFADAECSVIPIGIDTKQFSILDKKKCKKMFGFSESTKIILMGAQSTKIKIKGYIGLQKMFDVLETHSYIKQLIDSNQIKLVFFGNGGDVFESLNIPGVELGFIEDRDKLCKLYNAADVFLFPSIQETFGMTAVEAMACGTPVVAYNMCAMQDVIVDGVNGFKIEQGNHIEMSQAIIKILQCGSEFVEPCRCRQRILDNYSLECETDCILHLYDQIKERFTLKRLNVQKEYCNEILEAFEKICTYEIMENVALNQRNDEIIQSIFFPFNLQYISPERKIKLLLKNRILMDSGKVILYGAGNIGKKMIAALEKEGVQIAEIWDTDKNKWGSQIGFYVIEKPKKKGKIQNEKIIISAKNCIEISENLRNLGYQLGVEYF